MGFPRALAGLLLLGCTPSAVHPSIPIERVRRSSLVSIERARIHVLARECRPRRGGCDILPRQYAEVSTQRIVFIDEDGVEQTVYDPDPGEQPEARARLCREHRGWPVGQMEHEARLLLEAADLLWREECEASIRAYQRLLSDYPEFLQLLGSPIRIWKRAEQGD